MSILARNKPVWMEILFNNYLWYRRWCGGHWECWWNDVCHSFMWDRLKECTQTAVNKERGVRPPCCYGTPHCEDYSASAVEEKKL